jgi:hypothetical protein
LTPDGSLPILLSLNGVGETQHGRQQNSEKDVNLEILARFHRGTSKMRFVDRSMLQAVGPNNSDGLWICLIFALLAIY